MKAPTVEEVAKQDNTYYCDGYEDANDSQVNHVDVDVVAVAIAVLNETYGSI